MSHKEQTSVPPISSLALRAALIPLLTLVLIARAAHREGTFVARNKDIARC